MTVLNRKKTGVVLGAVYIGRGTKWGNPYRVSKTVSRATALALYRERLKGRPDLVAAARVELKGKDLVCHCAPLACHGDLLHAIANEGAEP